METTTERKGFMPEGFTPTEEQKQFCRKVFSIATSMEILRDLFCGYFQDSQAPDRLEVLMQVTNTADWETEKLLAQNRSAIFKRATPTEEFLTTASWKICVVWPAMATADLLRMLTPRADEDELGES